MPSKKPKVTKAPPKGTATGEVRATPPDMSSNMEPPTKKIKTLKLNVRERPTGRAASSGSDTIAVSRPRRVSAQTPRYKQDIEMLDADDEIRATSTAPSTPGKLSAAPSSALSSAPSSEKSESPFRDPTPDDTAYGANFARFYITADERDNSDKLEMPAAKKSKTGPTTCASKSSPPTAAPPKEEHVVKPAANASKAAPVKATKQSNGAKPPQPFPPHPQSFQQHKGLHQQVPQQRQPPQNFPPPMPPQYFPPPQLLPPPNPAAYGFQSINPAHMIQMTVRASASDPPDTVQTMIEKVEALSFHLTDFGGKPKPPGPKHVMMRDGDHPLDNFLDIIDGESDESDEHQIERIRTPGVSDEPLRFGIEFIMNALGSWVESRARQDWQHEVMRNNGQSVAPLDKKGPGRPKKYSDTDFKGPAPLLGPGNFDYMASEEGQTIIAFQKVLDCGALQVGGVVPERLAAALSKLYLQIDKLINQNVREKQPWQPMSYTAQINAQRHRVEEWLAQEARHQQALADMYAQRDRQHQQMQLPARPGSSAAFPQQRVHQFQFQAHSPYPPLPPPAHVLPSSGQEMKPRVDHVQEQFRKSSLDNLPIDLTGRIQHTRGNGPHGPALPNGATSAPPIPHPFAMPGPPVTNGNMSRQPSNTPAPVQEPALNGWYGLRAGADEEANTTDSDGSAAKHTRSSLPVLTSNSSDALSRALGSSRRRTFGMNQSQNQDQNGTGNNIAVSSSPAAQSQNQTPSVAAPSHTTGFQAINKPPSRPASATATPQPPASSKDVNDTGDGGNGALRVRKNKTRTSASKEGMTGKYPHPSAVVLDV